MGESQHQPKRGFTWTPRPDNLQKGLLAICLFDLSFFSYYLFNFEMIKQSTISDTIFTDTGYKVVLTFLLASRLLGGGLFLLRFRFKHRLWEWAGYAGMAAAFGGWWYLVENKENFHHFIGVGVFCLGSFTYSLAFVRLAGTSEDGKELLHAIMELFLLLGVVVLVVSFVLLWFEEENDGRHSSAGSYKTQTAYIVEHTAYVVHLVFYMLFFLYHSPDPNKRTDGGYIGGEDYEADGGVPMICRPLIFQERLPVIIEVA